MTKIKKYTPVAIIIISIIIGVFFRYYKIGQTPQGLYLDEAALGYNAYSILMTGKDEFGKTLPIVFRSFVTFQSPVYTYLTALLLSIFDLSVFSTRLPSVIFGILTLPLVFLLVKEITPKKYSTSLSVASLLFLAISPWHILFSRTAYETTIALFFLLAGIYSFIKALDKPWLFILSSLSFAISFTAYRTEVLIAPIVVIFLAIQYHQTLVSRIKSHTVPIIISLVLGLSIIAPTVILMGTPGFNSRTTALNIFSYSNQMPPGYHESQDLLQKIINNPQALTIKEFASLYASYFSPRYLFSIGDSGPRSSYPDFGTFFVWQFPFFLAGLYYLIKDKDLHLLRNIILVLLLSSPIPASLTRDPYMTIRSLPMVLPLVVIISLGLVKILDRAWSIFDKTKYLIIGLLVAYSSIRLFISIFYFNDYYRSEHWDYGWSQVVESISKLDPNLPIIVDNSRGEPYINLLFFLKYDPKTYQQDNLEVPLSEYYSNMDRNQTKKIGRITVKKFEWGVDTDKVEKYIITDGLTISDQQIEDHNMIKVNTIKLPNEKTAIIIVKTTPK